MELLVVLLFIVFVILTVIISSVLSKKRTERDITIAGKQGEERTAHLLNSLPENYKLIRNAVINYEGRKSEIDNIVVGNTGVFIIETKNQKGHIVGDCQERDWTQHKIGRGGTPYCKDFYNPTKQVATHIYRLKGIFRQNKIRVFINGAVYFSNPETYIRIVNTREDIPVFDYYNQNELLNYILNRDKILTDKEVEHIIKVIKENDSHSI